MNIEKKLNALKDYVRSVADSDADELIREAEKRAEEVRKNYEETAEKKAAEILESAKKRADTAMKREISQSSAKTARMLMDARNDIFKDAVETLQTRVNELADGDSYPDFLKTAAIEAIEAFGEKKVIIRVRKKDRKLAEGFLETLKKRFKDVGIVISEEAVDIAGGVILESVDGRMVLENTLENKFRDIRERFSTELFSNLKQ